jgi:hypothetical protein
MKYPCTEATSGSAYMFVCLFVVSYTHTHTHTHTHTDVHIRMRGAGTTPSVWRRATCSTAGIRFSSGVRDIFVLQSVQTGSGANPALRHEGVCGNGCMDPYFLDLGSNWRCVISFTPLPLYPREGEPSVPIE